MSTQGQQPASISFASAYNMKPTRLQKSNMMWGSSAGNDTTLNTGQPNLSQLKSGGASFIGNSSATWVGHTLDGSSLSDTTAFPVMSPGNIGGTSKGFSGRVVWIEPMSGTAPTTTVQCDIYYYLSSTSAGEDAWFELRGHEEHPNTSNTNVTPSLVLNKYMTDAPSATVGFGGVQSATDDQIKFVSLRYTVPQHVYFSGVGSTNYLVRGQQAKRMTAGLYAGIHGAASLTIMGYTMTVDTHM